MKLFDIAIDASKNLLPYGGTVNYHGILFNDAKATAYLTTLLNQIAWKNDEAIIFGKKIITK
mgnify:CR=1 FL=1